MVFSYSSNNTNNITNDTLKINGKKSQNNNVIENISRKYSNIKTFLNFDKNSNNNDNINENINNNINKNQKDINRTISNKHNSNNNMNSNNNSNNFVKESIKKNNKDLLKNEKINKLSIINESKQNCINSNQSNVDKRKIGVKVTNVVLKKEKDIININDSHIKESGIISSKSNINSINNKHDGLEPIKKNDNKSYGKELVRPVIKRQAPFIPTISDNKKNEKGKAITSETKNVKNRVASKNNFTKYESNSDGGKSQTESTSQVGSLKTPLSNSQAALISNTAFKAKKEMTNKRIVKAISKYKPVINIPSPNNSADGTFNIYKSAHLDFCRNCLIPKDVLYFQGLLLFKNISKLKGMNLSRQQINNALEWEVIKYTVFNSKSPDNWTNLLNQYKNDRTSTKILSKRYAARKQSQKCIKKETENFERKFIAYNIIKKKAPGVIDYYNSMSEQTL